MQMENEIEENIFDVGGVQSISELQDLLFDRTIDTSNMNILKKVVDRNMLNVNEDNNGYTSLTAAVCGGQSKVVEFLLEELGADINAITDSDEVGTTALYDAVFDQDQVMIRLLFQHGADMNAVTRDGSSITQAVIFQDKTFIIELFELFDFDVNAIGNGILCDEEEEFIDDWINNMNMTYLFDHGMDINNNSSSDEYRWNWMNKAAEAANLELIQLLYYRGAHINPRKINDDAPMFLLPQKHAKTEECARFFLQQQELDINMIDNEGASLLHWAVYLELPWMVKYLLSRGLDVDTESEYSGETALTQAVFYCNRKRMRINLARILLSEGADPDYEDGYSMTPLFRAIQREDLELIKLLMDEGFADCDFKNQKGLNAWYYAKKCEDPSIKKYFKDVRKASKLQYQH